MSAAPRPDPEQLAAELLGEAARARAQARTAVPLLLRSPDLLALAPPLQEQVLAHARRAVARDPRLPGPPALSAPHRPAAGARAGRPALNNAASGSGAATPSSIMGHSSFSTAHHHGISQVFRASRY